MTEIEGRGLFSGAVCRVRFRPAKEGAGISFLLARDDANDRSINSPLKVPARIDYLVPAQRRTVLGLQGRTIETVEHCLSACAGLGLDNVDVEVSGPEMPAFDGSGRPFAEALKRAGIVAQAASKRTRSIPALVRVFEGDSDLVALPPTPGKESVLEIFYDLDYGDHPAIGRQFFHFTLSPEPYATEVAPARTFVLDTEIAALQAKGYGRHLTYQELLVFGLNGPLDNALRFPDECARHKVLDLIGDLFLLGEPLAGRIFARKSGHALNHELVRRLVAEFQRQSEPPELRGTETQTGEATRSPPALGSAPAGRWTWDAQALQKMLPHRYPFLLVDRVLEVEKGVRIVAIKNVTLNEPFFQGHYPSEPIMPGVLIVEAMSQVAGLLLDRKEDSGGQTAVLMSLDRVKFRQPVWPGDQLVIEAELVRSRARVHHLRARARVAGVVVTEAEIRLALAGAAESRQVLKS